LARVLPDRQGRVEAQALPNDVVCYTFVAAARQTANLKVTGRNLGLRRVANLGSAGDRTLSCVFVSGVVRSSKLARGLVDHAPAFHGPAVKRNHSYRTP
jgi:hypothetical protein